VGDDDASLERFEDLPARRRQGTDPVTRGCAENNVHVVIGKEHYS
jgi:hypothetical protein